MLIDVVGGATVTHSGGTTTVKRLVTNNAFTLSGGTLQTTGGWEVGAQLDLAGGTVVNSVLSGQGSGVVRSGQIGYLESATLGIDVTVLNAGRLYVSGGVLRLDDAAVRLQSTGSGAYLDFEGGGEQLLTGSGRVLFEGSGPYSQYNQLRQLSGGTTLVIDSGITVTGEGYGVIGLPGSADRDVLVRGTVRSGAAGISLYGRTVRNEGQLIADGGGQLYTYNLTNAATGVLGLNGSASSLYLHNLSKFEGDVSLAGEGTLRVHGTLDLQGHTLSAGAVWSSEQNPTVTNGRLDGEAAYRVEANQALYVDNTVTVGADIAVGNNARLNVSGALVLDEAAIRLQSAGDQRFNVAFVDLYGEQVLLTGTGEVLFEGSGSNYVRPITGNGVLTIDSGITLRGPGYGMVGNENNANGRNVSVVNKGTLRAGAGGLTVNAVAVRNEGTLQAVDGQLYTYNLTNAATGVLGLNGAASSLYLHNLSKFEGDVSLAGEGMLRVHGTLDLQGHTLSAGAVWSSEQNPTVTNVRLDGEAAYRVGANQALYVDNTITVGADIAVGNNARLYVNGGALVLDEAAVRLQSEGDPRSNVAGVDFYGEQVLLTGTGEVLFEGSGSNYVRPITGNGVLTIDSGITLRGPGYGMVGNENNANGRNVSVVNKGTLRAGAGGLTVNAVAVRNEGTLQAVDGQLYVGGAFEPNVGVLLVGAGSVIQVAGDLANAATGIVQVDLGGSTPTDFGRLLVGGEASLNGTLAVNLIDDYLPTDGQTFDFVTFVSSSGLFARLDDLDPGDDIDFLLNYNPTGLALTVEA